MDYINLTRLSLLLKAYANQIKANNIEWKEKTETEIEDVLKNLPSGSGLDRGVQFDLFNSKPEKMIFRFEFHHMNEHGSYDGWTEHKLIITPTFGGYDMNITGRDRNGIKEYLYQLFDVVFCARTESETSTERKAYYEEITKTSN